MDKDIARSLAVAAIRSSSMLTNVLPMLKEHCPPAEYEELRGAISAIAGDISTDVLRKVFKAHPILERELDEAIRNDKPLG